MNLHITLPPTLRRGGGWICQDLPESPGKIREGGGEPATQAEVEGDASVIFCNVLDVYW